MDQEVTKMSKAEVRRTLKRMKSGKTVGPGDIPVDVWKCLGEAVIEFLPQTFNKRTLVRCTVGLTDEFRWRWDFIKDQL